MVCFFAWIGIIFALIGSVYSNFYLGSFVKTLIEAGADSSENAKSLTELGIEHSPMLTRSLREGSVLRRTVLLAEFDNNAIDLSDKNSMAEKDYIPKENQDMAEKRFRVRGNGIISLILSIILITIILLLLLIYGPWLLGIADGLLAV